MLIAGRIVVGVILLVLGRRLYWLFVAAIGFMTGLQIAPRVLPPESEMLTLVLAVVLAIVGALIAVVATKVAIAIAGFAAGGAVAVALLGNAIQDDTMRLAAYVVAGIIGAILLLVLFDWALIVLSSLAGATLITVTAESLFSMPSGMSTAIIVVLAIVGVLIQTRILTPPVSRR